MTTTTTRLGAALLALPLLALAACAPATTAGDSPSASASAEDHGHDESEHVASDATESAAAKPRLVLTYEGGLLVVDASTLETVADLPLDGYLRVNPAGDDRHVLVSTTGGFRALDTGAWSVAHGDHSHHYVADPALTDVTFAAEKPGHAVTHHGTTALFDDGTGRITTFAAADLAHLDDGAPATAEVERPAAHHGVAVPREDGSLVTTDGTEESRSGVVVVDDHGHELARTDDCPGVHGEAVAAEDRVTVGCQDGIVVVDGETVTKIPSPDAYGRIGNQSGSDASTVVLGDYKSDPDAELERPTRVSLTDTATGTLRLVDLPASYTFRSLGRGDDGEALVLGTDGALHVIDPASGALTRSVPVVAPWTEPEEWQQARPALFVMDGTAFVTDPAARKIHAVDVVTGEVYRSGDLAQTPDEITGVRG